MDTLIFTVALNGYAAAYSKCLPTHRAYARRLSADYAAVTRPLLVRDPALAAWLKVPLALRALEAGRGWVAFVDADCRIAEDAPDFRTDGGVRDLGMALGRSKRINSGVLLIRNTEVSRNYLREVMASITRPIPEEDRAHLKYENGNMIHVAKSTPGVDIIDLRWNNTYRSELDDYLRHYTGPLRKEYERGRWDTLRWRACQRFTHEPQRQPEARSPEFDEALQSLTRRVARKYPEFDGR